MRSAVHQRSISIDDADANNAPPLLFGGMHHDKAWGMVTCEHCLGPCTLFFWQLLMAIITIANNQHQHRSCVQVDKQATRLYSMSLTSEQIEGGLLVSAYSTVGSRFKLVLFEKRGGQGQWHLVTQEDSNRTGKYVKLA